VAARSEGGRVKVNGDSTTMAKTLRKRMSAACSEGGVKAAVCSRDGDVAAACSRVRIMDSRWRWRYSGF
jgi:hypothetical protein